MPGTDVVAVDVWVRGGAIAEVDDWLGMAHFLEHMIFKGSDRILPGQFDRAIECHGGSANAATSHDYAHFFMVMAAPHFARTLPYLAELLLHPALPANEFGPERQVVLEEMRQAWNNPDWMAFQAMNDQMYQHHAYGRPILGTPETLEALDPDRMRCFHRAHYQPENMTIVVVGDLSAQAAIDLVGEAFAEFEPPLSCPRYVPDAEPPLTEIRRQELVMPYLEQARLILAWTIPGIETITPGFNPLRRGYGLDLLSVLLTGGRTSRLVRELREERGLVQGIDACFSLQQDSGLFTLTAWGDPADLERVEAILGDRISELSTGEIAPAELARAQRLVCNEHAYATETADQLAGLYGYYSLWNQLDAALTYPEQIQSITAEELRHLASQFLSPYRYGVTTIRPAA
jgi:predicted Zn-dependent peptidase